LWATLRFCTSYLALNLIAGDGQTNVLHLNTLDYDRWHERVDEDELWRDIYGKGWKRLKRLRADQDNRCFEFDVLMANPPFAGDIKESLVLAKYELGKKPNGKRQIGALWKYSLGLQTVSP